MFYCVYSFTCIHTFFHSFFAVLSGFCPIVLRFVMCVLKIIFWICTLFATNFWLYTFSHVFTGYFWLYTFFALFPKFFNSFLTLFLHFFILLQRFFEIFDILATFSKIFDISRIFSRIFLHRSKKNVENGKIFRKNVENRGKISKKRRESVKKCRKSV